MRYTSSCCYILITLRRQIGACIIAGGALACLLNATPANAQVDSLRQIIADPHSTLADKGMANLGLARAFAPVHTDTALYYAGEGLRYGQRSGDAKVEGSAYRYLGLIHASQQSYSEALSYYQKALETLPAVPDSGNIKAVYGSIGVLYMHLKDYTQALHYFEKGLDFTHDTPIFIRDRYAHYSNISFCFSSLGQHEEAVVMGRKALATARLLESADAEGTAMHALASNFMDQGSLDSAAYYYEEAFERYRASGNVLRLTQGSVEAIPVLLQAGRLDLAQTYCDTALHYARKARLPQLEHKVREALSSLYLHKGDYASARREAELGLALCDSAQAPPSLTLLENAAKAHIRLNNPQKAAEYLLRLNEMRAKFLNDDGTRQAEAVRQHYLLGEQEKINTARQTELKGQRNVFITAFSFALALVVVIVVALWQRGKRNRMLQAQKKQIEQQRNEMENLNRTKDKLLAILGHDLRNGIAKSRFLLSKTGESAESAHVRRHFEDIADMLENLLLWAKSQMHYLKVAPSRFNLYDLAGSLEQYFYLEASGKDLILINDIPPALSVYTDKSILRIVLHNVLSNAVRHTPAEGTVRLWAEAGAEGHLRINISNTGQSIGSAEIERLERREFLNNPDADLSQAGIGLLVSLDLLDILQGKMQARPATEGGSVFEITLDSAGDMRPETQKAA
ncbi:MAG: tetratricopeptide repeat protein [Saprospiraceae bacterium]|nr:tetratricopeptide repeat protein [Saprospiraceae bacterium]